MPLHVTDAAHGLDLGLEGGPLVPVPVVSTLKQVLVPSVAGVLVAHPAVAGKEREREASVCWSALLLFISAVLLGRLSSLLYYM